MSTLLAAAGTSTSNSVIPGEGEENDDEDDDDPTIAKPNSSKSNNVLPINCDAKMGLNSLIYSNIQQSPYFKSVLSQLKTYHEVLDEIFYHVKHLEPWEKGSRKVSVHDALVIVCRSFST